MRTDTKRLLDRLGQPEFQYREYEDASSASTERWPLFEVIDRHLNPVATRAPEETVVPLEADTPAPPENDIQALIARIAKGRPA